MRILIVEDEKKVAAFIKKGLEEETYAVDVAYDGEDGLHMGVENQYDLIILDLMLPIIDGLSVLSRLREKKVETPILLLTAKDSVEDKVTGLNTGADDYLTKPFAFSELLARIRVLLRRGKAETKTVLQIDGLSLDLVSHKVKRNDEELMNDKDLMREWSKNYPIGRFGQPEDVAQACLFLASDESSFVTGAILPVDGGYTAL